MGSFNAIMDDQSAGERPRTQGGEDLRPSRGRRFPLAIAERAGGVVSRALLVLLFGAFAWSNLAHWRSTGEPTGLGLTLLEGWVALMFLFRRPADSVSRRGLAWVAAPIATFAVLLTRPEGDGLPSLFCESVQFGGVVFALFSLGALGRSFGLVAANRGVKTGGPYGLVRHPAYTGYLITGLGYIAEHPTLVNIALLCIGTAFQLIRIHEEEHVLLRDSVYERYRRRVRYRLIPLIY
jgi:protein-S-isoprenylcysteine O-methyltransferase Ste14